MAFFVLLNGPRAEEVHALHPEAMLMVGGGPNSHIQLADVHVADIQGQVYPAEGFYWFQDLGYGFTFVNGAELTRSVHQLMPNDVLQLGRTFLRFVLQPPAGAGGGEVEALRHELAVLREESQDATMRIAQLESTKAEVAKRLEAARNAESAAAKDAKRLAHENATLVRDLERLRAEVLAAGGASEEAGRLGRETAELRAELERVRGELAAAREEMARQAQLHERIAALEAELAPLRDAEAQRAGLASELADVQGQQGLLRDRIGALEAELARLRAAEAERDRLSAELVSLRTKQGPLHDKLAGLEAELARLRVTEAERDRLSAELAELEASQGPREDRLAALEAELARLEGADAARARLEAELDDLVGRLAQKEAALEHARAEDARGELLAARALLDAARDALLALGVPPAFDELPRGALDDPGALLDGAGLPPEVRRTMEASLTRHVERETLRRLAGMVPAFATLDEAGPLREELRLLDQRATRLASALGLSGSDG